MRQQTIELATLTRDERFRFREGFNIAGKAEEYAEAMKDADGWGQFPALTCIELTEKHTWREEEPNTERYGSKKAKFVERSYEAGTLLLVGGFTRSAAADEAAVHEAPANIYFGTWADALRLAWKENAYHGKPRSQHEIELVLASIHLDAKLAKASLREVAQHAGCSYQSVRRYRLRQTAEKHRLRQTAEKQAHEVAAKVAEEVPPAKPLSVFDDRKEDEEEPEDESDDDGDDDPTPPPAAIPATAGASPSVVRKDSFGRPIPFFLEPLWEHVGSALKISRELKSCAQAIVILKHGPEGREECVAPGLARVDAKGAAGAILHAMDMVENALPWIVCPVCDGHGKKVGVPCKPCRGLGALTKVEADALHGELDRKARSFQGVAA